MGILTHISSRISQNLVHVLHFCNIHESWFYSALPFTILQPIQPDPELLRLWIRIRPVCRNKQLGTVQFRQYGTGAVHSFFFHTRTTFFKIAFNIHAAAFFEPLPVLIIKKLIRISVGSLIRSENDNLSTKIWIVTEYTKKRNCISFTLFLLHLSICSVL